MRWRYSSPLHFHHTWVFGHIRTIHARATCMYRQDFLAFAEHTSIVARGVAQ
jgi:hypothetical protein